MRFDFLLSRTKFQLTFYEKTYILKMKERRRINARVFHQHASHVVVAPGVLSFFEQIRVLRSSATSGFISDVKNLIP